MAGEQSPSPLCGHKVGKRWIDDGTNCRARNKSPNSVGKMSPAEIKRRKLATALHAQDARALLKAKLPVVLDNMTEAQIRQVQMVLDAAVIDPEIEKQEKKYLAQAGVWNSHGYAIFDEGAKRKADRVMEDYISVGEWDKRIRLDYTKLVQPHALDPVTDNPDEATYLDMVKKTLDQRGIWLQYGAQLVRDPEDPSSRILDPRTFDVWLTLGPNGSTIPTTNGKVTRDVLLDNRELGAGYCERVYFGPIQKALERETTRLHNQIASGRAEHNSLGQERRHAPIVSTISDVVGGADFPDYSIWDPPFTFVLSAQESNVGGNVKASQALLVSAAILTRTCAQVLAEYVDKTSDGANRVVKVLKVAKAAGEVASAALAVTGVVGAARAGIAAAAEGSTAAATSEVDVLAKKMVDQAIARDPELATELNNVRWVRGPKGSIGGFVKPNHSYGLGTGWQKWP